METERNGFSIIGFIAQVLVILLFVFVLMWLFPTKSYIENNAGSTSNSSNTATNELLFNQNLLSMKDAGREYFTVSRMPSKNGKSVKLTLEEMINKSLVVELIDGNGKKCDTAASYIEVTKINDEYEMIVSLTCSDVTKTIKTVIGCYDYCQDDICEKDDEEEIVQTLYQYKKTTEGSSKWSDWSNWTKDKVVATDNKKVETKTENEKTGTKTETTDALVNTTYSCPEGYSLSSDNKTCSKQTSNTETIASTAKVTYSCPSGYNLSNDKTKCNKSTTSYKDKVAVYACENEDYTLSGKTCTKTLTKVATPHVDVSFSCASGACQTITKIDYYYCSDKSYKLSGKTCTKTLTEDAIISSYTCPTGYKMNSAQTTCYKTTNSSVSSTATTNYSCPTNYVLAADKKTCSLVTSNTLKADVIVNNTYSCTVGTLNKDNKCETIVDVYEDVTYYRFKTFTKTPAKTSTKWSVSNNDKSLINQGYKYTGVTKEVTSK